LTNILLELLIKSIKRVGVKQIELINDQEVIVKISNRGILIH